VPSIHAGNDMIMVTPEFYEAALTQIKKGKLAKEEVELACKRVLTHKFELGLFDHKRYPPIHLVPEVVGCADHREPLLRAALESIVLLKNEKPAHSNKRILPLSSNIRHLALLGPNADDTLAQLGDWSFGSGQASLNTGGHPRHLVSTVRDGVREKARTRAIGVDYERGCEVMSNDTSHIQRAADLAAAADVAIVVVGDVIDQTGETKDRYELDLTGGQMPLLEAVKKTGTPLVVVLINSKPLCIPWVAENADAIIEAFNPGMKGGEAIAEILFGEANPMGKLTLSFPAAVGQQPVHYQQIPGWHGNRHTGYTNKPLFAFGYGLSYTTYSYEKLELSATQLEPGEKLGIEVSVKNTGGRAGTEIVQLYINDVVTSLSTPEKTLKRYARVHLERGQSEVVRFELGPDDFTFIGRDNRPISEPGEFELMVGSSSRDEDLLKARFTLLPE
jgi:beta-glucosidase